MLSLKFLICLVRFQSFTYVDPALIRSAVTSVHVNVSRVVVVVEATIAVAQVFDLLGQIVVVPRLVIPVVAAIHVHIACSVA